MKLIDILVRVLPGRGGWHDSVSSITQDNDSKMCRWRHADPQVNDKYWSHHSGMGLFDYDAISLPAADDRNYAIVTREQYESALASYASQIAPMGTVGDAVAEAVNAAELRAKGGQISAGASYNLRDSVEHIQGAILSMSTDGIDNIAIGGVELTSKNPYRREIKPGVWVDVYDVLNAWAVTNPALQHLLKKALQPGERGHKSREQDLQDIIDSAVRAKELEGL